MKETITFNHFCDRFRDMDRESNFSYGGKRALFDYLEELGDDIGEEYTLDIIALCCEYSEYKDINEYLKSYKVDLDRLDFDTEKAFNRAVKEDISEKTTLIIIDGDSFIIGDY